jgi:hypothetical protein
VHVRDVFERGRSQKLFDDRRLGPGLFLKVRALSLEVWHNVRFSSGTEDSAKSRSGDSSLA